MKTVADNSIRFVELRQSIMFADKVEDIGFTVGEWQSMLAAVGRREEKRRKEETSAARFRRRVLEELQD